MIPLRITRNHAGASDGRYVLWARKNGLLRAETTEGVCQWGGGGLNALTARARR